MFSSVSTPPPLEVTLRRPWRSERVLSHVQYQNLECHVPCARVGYATLATLLPVAGCCHGPIYGAVC